MHVNLRITHIQGALTGTLIVIALLLTVVNDSHAKALHRGNRIVIDSTTGTADMVFTRVATEPGANLQQVAREFIGAHPDLFRLESPNTELKLMREGVDRLGFTHVRFQQVFRGLRVWGHQNIVHFDDEGTLYLVAGQTIPTPTMVALPSISELQALEVARILIHKDLPDVAFEREAELLVYPGSDQPRLAWLVTSTGSDISAYRWRTFVDANSAAIVLNYNDVYDDGPALGSGVDVELITRPLNTYQFGADFQLIDATLPMFTPPVSNLEGVLVTYQDLDNNGPIFQDPNGDNVFDDAAYLRAAVSGHYNARLSYEYFLNTHGWNSYDNQGSPVIVSIMNNIWYNAQWTGEFMRFGRGDGSTFLDMSGSLDVVAHEFSHGVVGHTAGFIYMFQGGALHEAYSDFFGAMVDRDDWVIGDPVELREPYFYRSLEDPHLGLGGPLPAHMSEYLDMPFEDDYGGAHVNMGIPCKAGYLMATASSREAAEQIWFRAASVYLTPMSEFDDWADMCLQSAIDLYGLPSPEASAVSAALDSVGLGAVAAYPAEIEVLPVALGTSADTTFRLCNLNIQPLDILAATTSNAEFTLTGPFPQSLQHGEIVNYTLAYDATAAGSDCELGCAFDTVVFTTSSLLYPEVRVPVMASVGYTSSAITDSTFATGCTILGAENTPSISQLDYNGTDLLSQASLLIGLVDETDTVVYANLHPKDRWGVDLYYGHSYTVIDDYAPGLDVKGRDTRSVRITTEDGRIQGSIQYRFRPSETAECTHYLIDYELHNPCDTPLTILVGWYGDFDLSPATSNYTGFDGGTSLVYMRDGAGYAAGLAMLVGSPRNMRALNHSNWVYTGLTESYLYTQLAASANTMGSLNDWVLLMTFGEVTLAPGDSVKYTAILLHSDYASIVSDVAELQSNMCGVTLAGDVNMDGLVTSADIIGMVNYVFKTGAPPKPCEAAGDVNIDGSLTSADVIWLVNYSFKSGAPPLDVCDLVPETWSCY